MADIERSICIAEVPEKVFRFVVSQWEGTLDFWAGGIEDWTPLTSPPLREGSRVEYVGRMLGLGFAVRMEVTDFREGRGWTARSMTGPPVRGDWRFDPADGGTRFSYRLRYRMPPPVLGPLMDKLLLEKRWASAIEASLANAKAAMAPPMRASTRP